MVGFKIVFSLYVPGLMNTSVCEENYVITDEMIDVVVGICCPKPKYAGMRPYSMFCCC